MPGACLPSSAHSRSERVANLEQAVVIHNVFVPHLQHADKRELFRDLESLIEVQRCEKGSVR